MKSGSEQFAVTKSLSYLVILVALCVGSVGCSTVKAFVNEKDAREPFRSRDQYVRVIKQDSTKSIKPPANEHPVSLDEDQLRMALGSLEFTLPKQTQSLPVFSKTELDLLSKHISNAIAVANPDEDVAFAVVGNFKAVYGLAKEEMFTSGRVFYRDGKLNIIFYEIQGKYWPRADRRMNPLAPGSRFMAVPHEWALLSQLDQEYYKTSEGLRTDWIILDLAAMQARAAMGEKQAESGTAVQPFWRTQKSVEERLKELDELKQKKIITEEEYKVKRVDILKDL
jgi:hypothetical protein